MSLRDKKFIRTKITKSSEPLVTIGAESFYFNSAFVKEGELKKNTRVAVFIDEEELKIGFEFHSRENENSFTLQTREGVATIKAQEVIRNSILLKKINSLRNQVDKRFPVFFDRNEKLWIINLCPAFEIPLNDSDEVNREVCGIYRYLDGKSIVYIGRGKIKSRLSSPERREWKFDKIEYSIVESEDKRAEWEAYWIRRYREDNQGQLPYYNKIEGHIPRTTI